MFTLKRLFSGAIVSILIVEWTFIAVAAPNGFTDLLVYLGPALLLAIAVVWLFFTFADNFFTWSRALFSVMLGAAVLTPALAYYFSISTDDDLIAKFFFMIAIGWAASVGGTLWNLTGAASDAFSEWRAGRKARKPRRIYVPA